MPNLLHGFDCARLLVDSLQGADANTNTLIDAWNRLQISYMEVREAHGEYSRSFTSWGLTNLDTLLITRIGECIHAADFKSLSPEKSAELRKIAKAFNTDAWMIYFVLGKDLIAQSIKALKLILRLKRTVDDLTLEVLRTGLEKAREERRGIRLRNVSNDMTKFTYNDIARFQHALCPETVPYRPFIVDYACQNSAPLDSESIITNLPSFGRKSSSPNPTLHLEPSHLGNGSIAQNPKFRRQCTMACAPSNPMDEVSPQAIIDMITTTKKLSPLSSGTVVGKPAVVDGKVWALLQKSITELAIELDPTISPANIMTDLGFPRVEILLGQFLRYENLTSSPAYDDSSMERYINNGYLFYLCNYASAARLAIASAQTVGDLVRCIRYVVQTLLITYEQNLGRLGDDATPPSVILKRLMLNMQKETVVLMQSLDIIFHRSEVIVRELTSYVLEIQGAENQLLTDCSLQSVL